MGGPFARSRPGRECSLFERGARGVGAAFRTLRVELLEDRCLLSGGGLDDYDRIAPDWFAAPTGDVAARAIASSAAGESSPGSRWIVRLTEEATAQARGVDDVVSILNSRGPSFVVVRGLGLPGQVLVTTSLDHDQAQAALGANSRVASFEADGTISGEATPNDTRFGEQWALANTGQSSGTAGADIDATAAWDVTTGSGSIVVAVIDSGIDYTHPDLEANLWTNSGEIAGNGIDDDHNGVKDDVYGYDFLGGDSDPADDQGHGTHVAGVIAAQGNNGAGVAGVSWSSKLMALKILNSQNEGSLGAAVAAIQYVTMMRTDFGVNVRVINASWGSSSSSRALQQAIFDAGQAGILFVAAAGNGNFLGRGVDNDKVPFYPASLRMDTLLSVTATDQNDQLASFANYGPESVDVAAPGVSILSTGRGGGYELATGTSSAAPLVSGVAALVWAQSPDATVTEVRDAILDGADRLESLNGKISTGARLNALKALQVDVYAPKARLVSAADITATGSSPQSIAVAYSDHAAIDTASLDGTDLSIVRRGSNPIVLRASIQSVSGSGPDCQAVYRVSAPGGVWDALDNGTYEIRLEYNQVRNAQQRAVLPTVLGTFQVDVPAVNLRSP